MPVVGGGYSGRIFAPTVCRRPPEKFDRASGRTSINLNLALSIWEMMILYTRQHLRMRFQEN